MKENTVVLTLKQIADWQLSSRDNIEKGACWAEMPSFQRGLVWKPAQIEVLWDSLMRGIPIGALSLLPIEGNERFQTGKVDTNLSEAYWVVDGQQRSNAIALGFKPFPDKNESILWLDMLPDRSKRTRRKFFFYVTTPGRPWGYRVTSGNDERIVENVSTDEYRRVLRDELKWDREMGSKPPTYKLWPVKAKLPVPFSKLREFLLPKGKLRETLASNDIGNFLTSILAEETEWARHFQRCWNQNGDECRARFDEELHFVKDGLSRVSDTKTIGLIAYGGLSGDENETQEADENSNLAVYFSRLNQGGTPPGREDLDYSILKSIVPELCVIDDFAKELMHPSRLANIAMLTYFSQKKKGGTSAKKWKDTLSRSDIYKLQFDEDFKQFIGDCTLSRFNRAMTMVRNWLTVDQSNEFRLPVVIFSSMAKDEPRLFRLLILLALLQEEYVFHIDRRMLITFVLIVSWFGNDECLEYDLLYDRLQNELAAKDVTHILSKWIGVEIEMEPVINKHTILIPPRMKDFEKILETLAKKDLDSIEKDWSPIGYANGLNRLWEWTSSSGRSFLLYTCRNYLDKVFKDYNPASAIWNEDDRPWDYDHIIPQDWLITGRGKSQGPFHRVVSKFLMSIGNIAPVPFSLNRSWHNAPPGNYLESDNELVFVDFCGIDCKRPSFVDERPKKGCQLEDKSELACNFAYMTATRWISLYKEWLRLPVFDLLTKAADEWRIKKLEAVRQFFKTRGGARFVYLWSDGKQYALEENWDWTRPRIACGVNVFFQRTKQKVERCFLSVCTQKNKSYNDCFEVGLRRRPESDIPFDEQNEWWIKEDNLFKETDSLDEALEHLKHLLDRSDIRFE